MLTPYNNGNSNYSKTSNYFNQLKRYSTWRLGQQQDSHEFLVSRLQPKGLWIHACASVRASVTPYLEIRASDFDDFLHKATS